MMLRQQMGINGPIGPPPSLTGSQPQIGPGPGPTQMINNPMMHGTPGGMHVRVPYLNIFFSSSVFFLRRRCIDE